MKKVISLALVLVLCLLATPSKAQIQFGVQAGLNFSNVDFDDVSTKTATGWYVGPTLNVVLPIVGLGVDGSLFYSRRATEVAKDNEHFDYIAIPVNLKYQLQLPAVQPYIFLGPEFSFKVDDSLSDTWKKLGGDVDDYETTFNVGVGVELLNNLMVQGAYNWGNDQHTWRLGLGYYF